MALLNGVALQTGTNIVVPTTTGTLTNGVVRMNGTRLEVYYSAQWNRIT